MKMSFLDEKWLLLRNFDACEFVIFRNIWSLCQNFVDFGSITLDIISDSCIKCLLQIYQHSMFACQL